MRKKIVTIGGGSGQYVLLAGLRDIRGLDIKAVVSMVDSGGSTGVLRDELGVLPPGDILKCLLALSKNRKAARDILQKRFNGNKKLANHNAGNFLLTMLSQYCGDFAEGVRALGEILETKGKILPVTTDKATLVAELNDGSWLFGEKAIDVPRGNQLRKIKKTFLIPHHREEIEVYPPVIKAIKEADYMIVGPGDLYTSIVPNFLVPGVKEAIKKSKAKLVYVVNIMTKFGETEDFTYREFIKEIEKFSGRKTDFVIFNKTEPPKKILQGYTKQKSNFVEPPKRNQSNGRKIIKEDLLNISGNIVRHDSNKLAQTIIKLI